MHLNFLGIRSQIAGEENNHDDHKPPPLLIPLMPLIHYCNKIDAVVDYNIWDERLKSSTNFQRFFELIEKVAVYLKTDTKQTPMQR